MYTVIIVPHIVCYTSIVYDVVCVYFDIVYDNVDIILISYTIAYPISYVVWNLIQSWQLVV